MTRVRLTRELAADGFSPTELAALRRAGTLHRVRRGAYAHPPDLPTDPVRRAELVDLHSAVQQLAVQATAGQADEPLIGAVSRYDDTHPYAAP